LSTIADLKKLYDSKTRSTQALIFTQEQLTKIKEDAYNFGFQAAKDEIDLKTTKQQEVLQHELMLNLQTAVIKCSEEQQTLQSNLGELILTLSIHIFKKIFPVYAEKGSLEELNTFIESQISQLHEFPELIITVHSENLKDIESMCKKIITEQGLKISLIVRGREEFDRTDCTINWESGHIEKRLSNILQNLPLVTFEPDDTTINEER